MKIFYSINIKNRECVYMENEKKKINKSTIIIVILVILLIGSIGYIAYDSYFYKYFKKDEVKENNSDKEEQNEKDNEKDSEKTNNEIELNLNDSPLIERLKRIIPIDNSGKDAYQSKKVTVNDISNEALLSSVTNFLYYGSLNKYCTDKIFKNDDFYRIDEDNLNKTCSDGIIKDGICLEKAYCDNYDDPYVFSKNIIAEIVKKIYGDVKYTDADLSIYRYTGCPYKDGLYYCDWRMAGQWGTTVCNYGVNRESKFIKATKKDDEIFLYEKYVLYDNYDGVLNEKTGLVECKTKIYKYGDKSEIIGDTNKYDEDDYSSFIDYDDSKTSEILEDYEDKATIYKHTFKDDGTGNYIWISTEPTN